MIPYRRVVTPSGKRSLKKLPKQIRADLLAATEILETNPRAGEKLSGALSFLYSFHFRSRTTAYRMAYTIDDEAHEVVVHFADTRENFYEKLRRLFR